MILRAFVIGLVFIGAFTRALAATAAPPARPTTLAAPAATAASDAARTVRLEVLTDGLILVPVTVNGSGPHLFILDTGGASTIVSETLARQLELLSAGSHRIDTLSGSRTVGVTRLDELRLASETFTALDVLWMDLTNVRAGDKRIQGVIGQDLLRTRSFILDYESRRLTFDPADVWEGQRLPLDWSDGRPLVRAVARHAGRDGKGQTSAALRFVIDSGGTHVILFDRPPAQDAPEAGAAQPLVNALRRGAAVTMKMTTHAGSKPVMTATLDRLELTEGTAGTTGTTGTARTRGTSGTALRDVVAALVPMDPEQGRIEDGLLPASLFRAIYFDNRANKVVLRGR